MGLRVRNSLHEGEPCAGPFSASNDKISKTNLNEKNTWPYISASSQSHYAAEDSIANKI